MLQLVGWSQAESRDAPRADRQAAEELAAIRIREGRLAARRAGESDDAQSGSGVAR
jgi:hypothetical protein